MTDFQQIANEVKQKIEASDSFSMYIVNSKNRRKNAPEYTSYDINMESIDAHRNIAKDMLDVMLQVADEYGNKMENYITSNSKDEVEKLSLNNPCIKEAWQAFKESIENSDSNSDIKDVQGKAIVVVCRYTDEASETEQKIYLISHKKIILNYNKNNNWFGQVKGREIIQTKEPYLQFNRAFDYFSYKGYLYAINLHFESLFDLIRNISKAKDKALDLIQQENIIDNFDDFKKIAQQKGNIRQFPAFSPDVFKWTTTDEGKAWLRQELKIETNEDGKYHLTRETASLYIDATCGKVKTGIHDGKPYKVSKASPIS